MFRVFLLSSFYSCDELSFRSFELAHLASSSLPARAWYQELNAIGTRCGWGETVTLRLTVNVDLFVQSQNAEFVELNILMKLFVSDDFYH